VTVSDARVSGNFEGDCAGDTPIERSTIRDGGFRVFLCLFCSSVVKGLRHQKISYIINYKEKLYEDKYYIWRDYIIKNYVNKLCRQII
jgi:hypothetical protein